MSIFSRKNTKSDENTKAKEPPKNFLSTSKSFFFGGSTAGVYVNEDTALRTAAVYSCVRVISEAIASLPLNIYEYDGDGRKLAPKHGLYRILHYEPNPEMNSFTFRETMMNHLLLYGNSYSQIIRDNSGRVKALYPLLPNKVDVKRAENGELYYTYWRNEDEKRRGDASGAVVIPKDYVLHIAGLSYDGLIGYSPIALARNAIGLAIATENYGAEFFSNSANPGGIVEATGTVEPDDIRKIWESMYKGNGKSHRLAVLEGIINAYEAKTGLSRAKISHFMDTEKCMNAKEAVNLGFADGILYSDDYSHMRNLSTRFNNIMSGGVYMSTALQLREKRAKTWENAKTFHDSKLGEDGVLSAEDAIIYDKMEADVTAMGRQIERLERQEAIDGELVCRLMQYVSVTGMTILSLAGSYPSMKRSICCANQYEPNYGLKPAFCEIDKAGHYKPINRIFVRLISLTISY